MESRSDSDPNIVSEIALRVALHTMKERCVTLQRRLTSVEEENQQLREQVEGIETPPLHINETNESASENFKLRLQLSEQQRQKSQLTEHINMVSNENRKLWSRLSQMAKEQSKVIPIQSDCMLANEQSHDTVISPRSCGGANQNLIRSKTFTQHSPNPHLRQKLITSEIAGKLQDISLDEVALDAFEHNNAGAGENFAEPNKSDLSLSYFWLLLAAESANSTDTEFNIEAKKCIEGLQELRSEALKQQQELKSTLTMLDNQNALQPCPNCAEKVNKPEMADKSLETDESLSEVKFYNNNLKVPDSLQNNHNAEAPYTPPRLNILQEKIHADANDKTCPMCGRIYSVDVSFNAFREHVEMHFIDDSIENSIDRNFEFISHAVGDF